MVGGGGVDNGTQRADEPDVRQQMFVLHRTRLSLFAGVHFCCLLCQMEERVSLFIQGK